MTTEPKDQKPKTKHQAILRASVYDEKTKTTLWHPRAEFKRGSFGEPLEKDGKREVVGGEQLYNAGSCPAVRLNFLDYTDIPEKSALASHLVTDEQCKTWVHVREVPVLPDVDLLAGNPAVTRMSEDDYRAARAAEVDAARRGVPPEIPPPAGQKPDDKPGKKKR